MINKKGCIDTLVKEKICIKTLLHQDTYKDLLNSASITKSESFYKNVGVGVERENG